uniref:HLA class II histocompatibility antigen, DM alpha chain n=1 Tax=Geotrypetes seraphini TaxID=260995 RepID=A0A6P8P5U0_GEOSA|nr:HLA class II histocompatibility antigen, DM alpha chain [Geotrypetes seraphini]
MGVLAVSLCLAFSLLHGGEGESGSEVYHVMSQVLYCQFGHPQVGLVDTCEDDEMFHFDFTSQHGVARLPVFQQLADEAYDPSLIKDDAEVCQRSRETFSKYLTSVIAESKGFPVGKVFTRTPLQLGKPNTLICYVSNFFPPTLNITWKMNGEPVRAGVTTTDAYPTQDWGFYMFSYLDIIPTLHDIYSCHMAQEGEVYSSITYWVPDNPIPSDLLETVLCAVAFGIGVICLIAGFVLIVMSQRPQCIGN